MQRLFRDLFAVFLTAWIAAHAWAAPQDPPPRPLRIVIDPGHTPEHGGALGARGIFEFEYNDALARKVGDALQAAGFTAILTRAPTESISLDARALRAEAEHADLFLSIHHDSAQPRYLEKTRIGSRDAWQTTQPIRGYSLFVSKLNPRFPESDRFATLLGKQLRAIGRNPSLHHAEAIEGENRELLDAALGIYRFDDLIVLKKNTVPAVLLEAGVIVDAADETWVSDARNQARIAEAIVAAVRAWVEGGGDMQDADSGLR